GMPVRKEAAVAPPSTVVNLMDALRRSVQAERPAARKGKAAEKVGRQSGKPEGGLTSRSRSTVRPLTRPIQQRIAFERATINLVGEHQPTSGEFQQRHPALRSGRPVGGVNAFGSSCPVMIAGGHIRPLRTQEKLNRAM